MKLILLTGSHGRVGLHLSKSFEEVGFEVRPISHTQDYSKYYLPGSLDLSSYSEVFIVHSGQPSAPRTRLQRITYLSATRDLIEQANTKSINFVLVSSLSAHGGNRSNYSKEKRLLEEFTIVNSGLVIKLGLVTGLSNGFDVKIKEIMIFLSFFRLSFIIAHSPVYYTKRDSLMNVASDLDKFGTDGEVRIYIDSEFQPLPEINVFLSTFRQVVASLLNFLSKLGSGRADALLSVMDGMKLPND